MLRETPLAGNTIAFLVALPFALLASSLRPIDLGLVAFLGVFQIALAYVLLTRSVRSVTALEAALLLLLEPVLPGPLAMAGAAVILTATAVHALSAGERAA